MNDTFALVALLLCMVLAFLGVLVIVFFYWWVLLHQTPIVDRLELETYKEWARSDADRDLSIVIPAFNERDRLPSTLERLNNALISRPKISYEVIIVDDGSSDDTGDFVLSYASAHSQKNVKYRLLRHGQNMGKGTAITEGVMECTGKLVLFMDADGSTELHEIFRLYERARMLSETFFIICGVRNKSLCRMSCLRRFLSNNFSLLSQWLSSNYICDTQCGFKIFSRPTARLLFGSLHLPRWAFDVELLYLCKLLEIKVIEEEVHWIECSGSKLDLRRDIISMLMDSIFMRISYDLEIFRI